MGVPSKLQLDKDEAFSVLAESICDTVGYSLTRTTEIAAYTWDAVGGEITQYLATYPTENLNSLLSNVRKTIKATLGWAPGKATLYDSVRFHETLVVREHTVEEVIEEHGSWRKILSFP